MFHSELWAVGKILSVESFITHSVPRSLMSVLRSLARMGEHAKEYHGSANNRVVQSEKVGQLSL